MSEADEVMDVISRRWDTSHGRGAHDYTDEGCRILAERAFKDVRLLFARAEAAEARVAALETALEPFKKALDLGDWDHRVEYMEGRDWDALRAALADGKEEGT